MAKSNRLTTEDLRLNIIINGDGGRAKMYALEKQMKNLSGNCVQRTNIQNLKAIHNGIREYSRKYFIVFKERIYKI